VVVIIGANTLSLVRIIILSSRIAHTGLRCATSKKSQKSWKS